MDDFLEKPELRQDLAKLLSKYLAPGNIQRLAIRVLDEDAVKIVLENCPEIEKLAEDLVEAMHRAKKLFAAIEILEKEASTNGRLVQGLSYIKTGEGLAALQAFQQTVHADDDPFLDEKFLRMLPIARRKVCAIGLGGNINELMGTGFLIGPDLVMTNFHVIKEFLTPHPMKYDDGNAAIKTTIPGSDLFFYFDYIAPPKPDVPPDADYKSVVVRAQSIDWLVKARCPFPNENKPPKKDLVLNRYDYAVIRLERDVGNKPSGLGGGEPRGWFDLNKCVDPFTSRKVQLTVLQHPGGVQQVLDMGLFVEIDKSWSRIFYSVNTANGSSGGPAIDKKGRLYAIHNSAVDDPQRKNKGAENRGVRIDLIRADLAPVPGFSNLHNGYDEDDKKTELPAESGAAYWSLTDDIRASKPIVGRKLFRQSIATILNSKEDRVLAVIGPNKDTGRRFSIELLQKIVGINVPVVRFKPNELRTLEPKDFLRALAQALKIDVADGIPEPDPAKTLEQWIKNQLPGWLALKIIPAQVKNPLGYPAWIVLDTIDDDRVIWADNLIELVAALMGARDPGQAAFDIPQLRWLVLGKSSETLPGFNVKMIIDDLSKPENTEYDNDFADCLELAWRSVNRTVREMPRDLLVATSILVRETAAEAKKPELALLAAHIQKLVLKALERTR